MRFASGRTRSLSAPGMSESISSTTVIFEPSASYTVAISSPMMPPPMTSRRFGISGSSSALVESMMRLSSYGKPGMRATLDPAAMMQWSNETVLTPCAVSTRTVWGEANCAVPCTTCTLRCFASPVRPLVSLPTTPAFHARSLSRLILGLPNSMPACATSSASVSTLAMCSSALDGMQPTFRHTPPSVG